MSPTDNASLAKLLYFSINLGALWLFLLGALLLKLSLLEKCETSGEIWDVINSKLWVKSFTALLHKAKTYPVVYDKWGILRKNFLNNLIEKDD